jgi:hypothetical protein
VPKPPGDAEPEVPIVGGAPEAVGGSAAVPSEGPSTSIRADLGRALADGLARAMAAGDMRAARIALAALSALMEDAPEQGGAPVVDLAAERRKRGER